MTVLVEEIHAQRRHFLTVATATIGLIGLGAAAIPFLESWEPSARAKNLGGPVSVDISKLDLGAMMKVIWRGQPIYIVNRTQQMLSSLDDHNALLRDPDSDKDQQPAYAKNEYRSIKPEYLVLVGICTHLGCAPIARFKPNDPSLGADWPGGFYCPCHGSKYDLSGRVFKDVPAPLNLLIPPYHYVSDTKIEIGSGPVAA